MINQISICSNLLCMDLQQGCSDKLPQERALALPPAFGRRARDGDGEQRRVQRVRDGNRGRARGRARHADAARLLVDEGRRMARQ